MAKTQDSLTLHLPPLLLTAEQVEAYSLPPAPAKRSDSRAAAFIAKHGDRAVELDALPPNVLQDLVREALEENVDKSEWERHQDLEEQDQAELQRIIAARS